MTQPIEPPISRQRTIAVVFDYAQPEFVDGVRQYCREHDVHVDSRWSIRGDWVSFRSAWDGVIYRIVDWSKDDLREQIGKWPLSRVAIDTESRDDSVDSDFYLAGQMAGKELVEFGAKRLVCAALSEKPVDMHFAKGAVAIGNKMGVPSELLLRKHAHTLDQLIDQFADVVASSPSELVGFCISQATTAYSVQNELLRRGVMIPEQVAMVVADKDLQQTAQLSHVPITGVKMDAWLHGFAAAEMLHHKLQGEHLLESKILIPPKSLVRRESTGGTSREDPVMSKALSFLRENFRQSIDVPDVVKAGGASRRLVEIRFREHLGRGVHEEITRMRIERAKILLTRGEMLVADISEDCGFSSPHYFSSAFKKSTGLSPRQFQKDPDAIVL